MDTNKLRAYKELLRQQEAETYADFQRLLNREQLPDPRYKPQWSSQGSYARQHHWGK
jgi:hypothetical protein